MRTTLTLLAALVLFAIAPIQPSAKACDMDQTAKAFWDFYAWNNYGNGVVNCTNKMCGGADRWWCRTYSNAWFWNIKGTKACGLTSGDEIYQVWHDLGSGWTYAGASFKCFCNGSGAGYCQWQ